VLAAHPRDSFVLATKLYFPMSPTDRGLSRAQVHKQLDASLARLRVDFVDLYQCHRFDSETPLAETMEALSEVVRAGKTRAIGFSEWSADEIRASLALSPPNVKFVSSQPQYSLLHRDPERDVFPVCAANGISQVVWSPLGQGVLTGKYLPGEQAAADTRRASTEMGWAMGDLARDDVLQRVQRLGTVAARLGLSTAQLALAWVLREPNVASAIVGASRPEQVRENARASGVRLDAETPAEIDTVLL
jgi:aryl-alcohol dehydrogenase-like predicted oxidoreductase